MDEFAFIRSVQQKNYLQPTLIKGIGDDAAVFRQPYQDIVTAVDTFVENVHFSSQTMKPFHIGYRVLAANISDMAAMGCQPAFYLISIVIPKRWSEHDLNEIYQGMKTIASDYRLDLIGGDTVSGSELVVTVTIIGYIEKNKAIYRSNAKNNDVIFVTGTLGDSSAGFHILTNGLGNELENASYFIERHRMPSPRVAFARELQQLSRVSLNDISDGIANEAAEIAEASETTMHLMYDEIPFHRNMKFFTNDQQRQWGLFGGEDFELIGTVAEKDWPFVLKSGKKVNTAVSRIGYVTETIETNGKVFLYENGKRSDLNKSGYTHLK